MVHYVGSRAHLISKHNIVTTMSQAQIDYLNSVKAQNNNKIAENIATNVGIDDAVSAFNGTVAALTAQKNDNLAANTQLTADNALIDDIIAALN